MGLNLFFFGPIILNVRGSVLFELKIELIVLPLGLRNFWIYSYANFFAKLNSIILQNALFLFDKLKSFV